MTLLKYKINLDEHTHVYFHSVLSPVCQNKVDNIRLKKEKARYMSSSCFSEVDTMYCSPNQIFYSARYAYVKQVLIICKLCRFYNRPLSSNRFIKSTCNFE